MLKGVFFLAKKKLISSPRCGAEWRLQFSCTFGVLWLFLNPNNQLFTNRGVVSQISPDSELAENGRCPRSGFDTMILSEEGGTEKARIFSRLLLDVKGIQRNVFALRFYDFARRSALTNLSRPINNTTGKNELRVQGLFYIAPDRHKTSYNSKPNFEL